MKEIYIKLTPLQLHKVIDIISGYRHQERDCLDETETYLLTFIQYKLEKEYIKVNKLYKPFY